MSLTATDGALKKTPFHTYHLERRAKMVAFAGYDMPVHYGSMTAEHQAVRNNVGLFDLSHMGEILVRGADSLAYLQKVTCNDVSAPGQIQYTALLYENGTFVDDLLLYRMADHFLMVVNASNTAKDFAWLEAQLEGDVTLDNQSDHYGLLALQGPNAERLLGEITDYDLKSLKNFEHAQVSLCGAPTLISRTGYTGEDGFEIYLRPDQTDTVWKLITSAGEKYDLNLIGLGARDTLRLEMKMALYGNDIDQTTSALEAGLSWIVKFDKGTFIGRDALLAQKEAGIKRRLVCIEFSERCVPRQGYTLHDSAGAEIGAVTSGAFSPTLQKPIALGYVAIENSKTGSAVSVNIRERMFSGEVVKAPFYKRSHRRPDASGS